MSVDQYQRKVNSLEKEIASLEEKKSRADKKAADEERKASNVTISKNAPQSVVRTKLRQIARHEENANKANKESAELQKRIADKRKKRNDAYMMLQREQKKNDEKNRKLQEKRIEDLQEAYENRINEIRANTIVNPQNISNSHGAKSSEYDVFVSHAWEDKESFVDEFVKEMRGRGIKPWYDSNEISWGESMREKIDDGLGRTKFGIVILSPDYIAEGKYWTKAELNGLFQKESINGRVLLPIWHNLTKQTVINFSPIIADRKAMNTATMTAKEIAEEIEKLLKTIDKSSVASDA